MKILSWNVNGIRAVVQKGFLEVLEHERPDVVCLQETKAFIDQLPKEIEALGYHIVWHTGTRPGYAGTAVLCKQQPTHTTSVFQGFPMFHEDGRLTEVVFDSIRIINGYFPNGGTRADGTEMLSYKLGFYDALTTYLQQTAHLYTATIIVGDCNIAHTEIDIARPKENQTSIGFLPIERERFGRFLQENNLVDVFRVRHPDVCDAYTWWAYRQFARERNVGWRIDYVLCTKDFLPNISQMYHKTDTFGSDHCPLVVEW